MHRAFALVLLLIVPACRDAGEEGQPTGTASLRAATLTVFAAASLADAFREVERAFEAAHPGVDVVLNLAGSQQLAGQLAQGAPGDVFAGAHQRPMEVAVTAGRIRAAAPRTFARNRLVVIVPSDNPGGVRRLQDLARPGLRLVLAAEAVPAGRYTRAFLQKAAGAPGFGASFEDAVLDNVASYEQNVRAVLTKVVLGEADAGVVYTSDAAGHAAAGVLRLEIPDALNPTAVYPIAPVEGSRHPELAERFIDFILSDAGQEILTRHGFLPVVPA